MQWLDKVPNYNWWMPCGHVGVTVYYLYGQPFDEDLIECRSCGAVIRRGDYTPGQTGGITRPSR